MPGSDPGILPRYLVVTKKVFFRHNYRMTDKDLIRKIKELKEVKPRKDWVVLTKSQILGEDVYSSRASIWSVFQWRLALVPVISVLVILGLFGFAQQTVPGDLLFSVKKATETVQVGLSSAVEKPQLRLELANKRLEELMRIAQANNVNNLGPAIEEFQGNVSKAAKDLATMNVNVTTSDPVVLKGLMEETKELTQNKKKVESVLGTQVGDTQDLENSLRQLEKKTAAHLIADLEERSLSEEDQALFEEAKEYFEAGEYSLALEKIWTLSNK